MKKHIFLLLIISLLFINCSKSSFSKNSTKKINSPKDKEELNNNFQDKQDKFVRRYEHNINNDIDIYQTKILYETNYNARQLLNNAKLSKNPYSLVKEAFDIHTKMQYGIFSILSMNEKKVILKRIKNI